MKPLTDRSLGERLFHAVAYEGLAVALSVSAMRFFVDSPVSHLGVLALAFSLMAMLWNLLFNYLFDRAQVRLGFRRGLWVRALHALLFEGGLVATAVPLAAWWLSIGLWEALVLDIGLILCFLPYTMVFNWAYDSLRERLLQRRERLAMARCSG